MTEVPFFTAIMEGAYPGLWPCFCGQGVQISHLGLHEKQDNRVRVGASPEVMIASAE